MNYFAEQAVFLRNTLERFFYTSFFKKIFFNCDPEWIHNHMIRFGSLLGSSSITRTLIGIFFGYRHPALSQMLCDICFENPIGLAAGFDKDALLTRILPSVGFGFIEVGSITGEPCAGNSGRHLWRLPRDKSLVIYYGLKNRGAELISKRLQCEIFRVPVGISVAKTNAPSTTDAQQGIEDYAKAFSFFTNIGAYTTINISCPNAYGGQPFSDPALLERLLTRIDTIPSSKPVFLKLSPDLSYDEIDAIIDVCTQHKVDGYICTNLIKDRSLLKTIEQLPDCGGISGKLIESRANDIVAYTYRATNGKKIIIGCGGIFSAEDAYRKIRLGASLLQMITGMIYEGPQVISQINQGLVRLLKKDGFTSITQAIGIDNSL